MDFPQSLLLMNDSLYGPFTQKEILDDADRNEADFVGLTDSFQHHYHLQSYFIYCKSSLCTHATFLNFWKKFIPQITRMGLFLIMKLDLRNISPT